MPRSLIELPKATGARPVNRVVPRRNSSLRQRLRGFFNYGGAVRNTIVRMILTRSIFEGRYISYGNYYESDNSEDES
jgi:hypothetical protein